MVDEFLSRPRWQESHVSANFKLVDGHSKHSLDVFGIANADLNVSFFVKAGGLVDRLAFQENASDGIECRSPKNLIQNVDVIDDSAVQMP